MENERRRYELRSGSRSRSRTPLVQSRISRELETIAHSYDLRNESREESDTPRELAASGSSSWKVFSSKATEQNAESITEKKKQLLVKTMSESAKERMEAWVHSGKKGERRSERQKGKRQTVANGRSGNKEDAWGGDESQRSCKNVRTHAHATSDYSSDEREKEDMSDRTSSGHDIYVRAGDWWNVFPKTDYTYSESSQCRYEIAPGVLAIPNMSRRSIHSNAEEFDRFSHGETESGIGTCDGTNLDKEIRSKDKVYGSHASRSDADSNVRESQTRVDRYHCHREKVYTEPTSWSNLRARECLDSDAQSKHTDFRKRDVASFVRSVDTVDAVNGVDSDAELEEAISSEKRGRSGATRATRMAEITKIGKIREGLASLESMLILWFSKLLEFLKLKTVKRRKYVGTYEYRPYQESRWLGGWRSVDRYSQYVYLLLVRVFFFDSWLLSRICFTGTRMHRKSWKLLWIVLLPLLLLAGCWGLPYLATLFQTRHLVTRQLAETSPAEFFSFHSIVDKLNGRIDNLEDRSVPHSDSKLNVSEALERLKESEYEVRSGYNRDGTLLLEDGSKEELQVVDTDTYAREIRSIKSQMEILKQLYSEVKLCCDTRVGYVRGKDFGERIEAILASNLARSTTREGAKGGEESRIAADCVLTDDRVREIVKEALKVYDADKTGRVDYALESAGGQIISTRCTQRYDIKTRAIKLLAFTLYHENNNPRTVIQGNPIQPGACWAFQGFPGYLLIKLRSSIHVSGFTIEHAPKSILPNGEMRSAPKKFNVWGFVDENDSDPVMFGDYEFAASDDSLQYFPVQSTTIQVPYEYVELRVHSNHGQLEYTCLYRFRVHGTPL